MMARRLLLEGRPMAWLHPQKQLMPPSVSFSTSTSTITTTTAANLTGDNPNHFLVVSLGNPGLGDLHSAGHFAVEALQQHLSNVHPEFGQSPFTKMRVGKKNARTSVGSKYTILQSPTFMNVSGRWIQEAWKELRENPIAPQAKRAVGLVVVHDELEADRWLVKIRKWNASHRGHNGVRDCMKCIQKHNYPGATFYKLGVGIGRPESRDRDAVSQYVLTKFTTNEKQSMYEATGAPLLKALQEIEHRWESANKA